MLLCPALPRVLCKWNDSQSSKDLTKSRCGRQEMMATLLKTALAYASTQEASLNILTVRRLVIVSVGENWLSTRGYPLGSSQGWANALGRGSETDDD
jgi:hypothetical protein